MVSVFAPCGLYIEMYLLFFFCVCESELLLCEVIPREEIPQPKQCP